jgi:trimeric autotransporter adhesin
MNDTHLIFSVFSVLAGVLLFGICSNIDAYAQQSSSPPSAVSRSFSTTTISAEFKAKMCDPNNPSLKVVNTTEARICGIPKTVKPPSLSTATPPTTSAVSSSSSKQQTTTAASTAVGNIAAPPKQQQQQITTTNDNNNALVRSTGGASGPTIAPASNLSNKSLSSQSVIAPQLNAINKQGQGKQQPQLLPISNGTELRNYTFASISPFTDPYKLMYLGYHGGLTGKSGSSSNSDSTNDKHDSNSKHTDSSKTESSKHSGDSVTHDDSSPEKKKTNNSKSSSHSDDSSSEDKTSHDSKSSADKNDGEKSSSSSDLGSARKEVDSIIKSALD